MTLTRNPSAIETPGFELLFALDDLFQLQPVSLDPGSGIRRSDDDDCQGHQTDDGGDDQQGDGDAFPVALARRGCNKFLGKQKKLVLRIRMRNEIFCKG